ncbi:hypothetical protein BGZ63DRAFT_399265 [Mariannaea sp. PMI_226]|nr:hypothetical protein BGZ63DRAFT_399265 [Mariannaea sp. PMI_226]
MISPRDRLLRQSLNPLSTNSLGLYNTNHVGTPMSAVSMTSAHIQPVQTPSSTIQPYNPQQWVAPSASGPERSAMQQFATEAQASPPPPPPYSPPRSQQQSTFEIVPATTSTPPPRINPVVHRPSPEPQSLNQSFPPPPGTHPRGGSRDRRFGLPSLGRRRESISPDNAFSPSPAAAPAPAPAIHSHRQSMIIQPIRQSPVDHAHAGPSTQWYIPNGPPAARRAASAGAVETPTSARSRSSSQTRWGLGMPVPPPPPGPPPASSRSHSVQGMDRTTVPVISPPTRRPPPSGVTTLGPVPPTPADWVDSDNPLNATTRGRSPGLAIDTASASASSSSTQPTDNTPSSASPNSGNLNRTGAVRHDKTILQRRAESRTRSTVRNSIDERVQPNISDIVVPVSPPSGLTRRPTIRSSTPRSAGRSSLDHPPKSGTDSLSGGDSRNSTPRAVLTGKLPQLQTETPPFTPHASKQPMYGSSSGSIPGAPKSLPTPPPHTRSSSTSRPPRDSSRPPSSAAIPISKHMIITQTAEQFASGTIERFQAFAAREVAAATDADRVRMFADFIVSESRIRRERYSNAIGAMGSEIFDLSRDLFRPMVQGRRASTVSQDDFTPNSSEPTHSQRGSVGSNIIPDGPQSAPNSSSIPGSPGVTPANWSSGNNYVPQLSPILSMSVSDRHEDGSSRGRPPSRWWEAGSQGESSGLERSKRESKYMGVSKTQWIEEDQRTPSHGGPSEVGSSSDYPPEKVGWHEPSEPSLTPQPGSFSGVSLGSSPVSSVNRLFMDVSRLVTMPPPYPRHHPAVNNNHPELTEIRTAVRLLSEVSEVATTKEKFSTESEKRRGLFAKAQAERRTALRQHLSQEIGAGKLGYADAAAIESDTEKGEIDNSKELEKGEYEKFQNEVVLPLNELLTGRIGRATDLFDNLARHLFDNGQNDADMPQEEGDDRPELLEKLTLLKWIFEARETLHRTIFDLLSDRNTRYSEVVVTPYRLSNNTEKLKSAEAFFAEDAAKRQYAFAHEVCNRTREFRSVVEESVDRGVALQLSAFWDIAPPLCELLDSIPSNLEGFNIQIPAAEFEENPSYHAHPMQYLFSLLLHTEKSTYQFIESHTNLLCLLHEVKEAVVHAKCKVLETQTEEANGQPIPVEERKNRAQEMKYSEEHHLTEDLKEKVRVVRDQWNSALGENITLVKERLGEWLLQTGGWDEALEDGGVGGV